jgi:hypothetical protein
VREQASGRVVALELDHLRDVRALELSHVRAEPASESSHVRAVVDIRVRDTASYLPLAVPEPLTCTLCHRSCDGTWGLAVLSKDEADEIVVACNGSPMVIGQSNFTVFRRH